MATADRLRPLPEGPEGARKLQVRSIEIEEGYLQRTIELQVALSKGFTSLH